MSSRPAAKASAAQSDAPRPGPATPTAENDVDLSVLHKLIEITRQQRQLDEFRTRAGARQDKVDPAVYRRVVDDYNRRDAELEKNAQPLKAQARREFEKLRAQFDVVNAREERARYDKQELEFRHEVGEMDAAQLAAQLKAPAGILEECQAELEALRKQKARFLEAFDEQELERPAEEPNADTAAEAETGPQEAPPGFSDATMMGPRSDLHAVVPAAPPARTIAPPPPKAAAPPPAENLDVEEYTFVLPEGMLIGDGPGGKNTEYRLSAVNYVGRADDNQVRITANGVSRKHAFIAADKKAFVIRDLKSQNGTFVNDEQVDERALKDGDVIKLGEARLVFKLARKGS